MVYADTTVYCSWFHLCYWLNSQTHQPVWSDKGTPGCRASGPPSAPPGARRERCEASSLPLCHWKVTIPRAVTVTFKFKQRWRFPFHVNSGTPFLGLWVYSPAVCFLLRGFVPPGRLSWGCSQLPAWRLVRGGPSARLIFPAWSLTFHTNLVSFA